MRKERREGKREERVDTITFWPQKVLQQIHLSAHDRKMERDRMITKLESHELKKMFVTIVGLWPLVLAVLAVKEAKADLEA